jgi:hypothetical protein
MATAVAASVEVVAAKSPSVTDTAKLPSLDKIASRILTSSVAQAGYRTMVAPENRQIDASEEAVALVGLLAKAGKQVVLVDWDVTGAGCAQALGLEQSPGITDLIQGQVSFEDVIFQLPGGAGHYIACGDALGDPDLAEDGDRLNLVLDALDEAYDHIVVVGSHDAARNLFEIIEGRFDAGITVAETRKRQPLIEDAPGSFLGFEVSDLDVIRFERAASAAADTGTKAGAAVAAAATTASTIPQRRGVPGRVATGDLGEARP